MEINNKYIYICNWGFHAKPIFFCNILSLPSRNSDSRRRYTLKCFCWCVQGKVGELVQPEGVSEDWHEVCFVELVVGGNYIWWLVIVVIFMRFGGAKRWGDTLETSIGGQCTPKWGIIFMGKGDSHYVILLYWNFIVSLTGYCRLVYRILTLFSILLLFYLLCIYWDCQDQKCYLKCPKNYEINTELWFMVISACTHPCGTNTFIQSLTRTHLLELKIHNIWMEFFLKSKSFERHKRNFNPKVIYIYI